MKQQKIKWRWILLPFLATTIIFLALYSLLHWLIVIKWGLPINGNVVEAYIPIIISFILTWRYIAPKLLLLKIKRTKSEAYRMFEVVAAIAMAAPVVFAQLYLVSATGNLSTLNNIDDISKNKQTKYYQLQQYHISKKGIGQYYKEYNSDLDGAGINCVLYVTAPIYANQPAESKGPVTYWLGINYATKLSANLSNEERRFQSGKFYNEALDSFMKSDLQQFSYLENPGRDGHNEEFERALEKSELKKSENPIVFYPRQGEFAGRNGNTFSWIFISFAIGFYIWFVMIAFPNVDYNVADRFERQRHKIRS